MMGDEWIPSEILEMQPVWRNFFENTATGKREKERESQLFKNVTIIIFLNIFPFENSLLMSLSLSLSLFLLSVQFDHRVLAMTTLAGLWGMYGSARTAMTAVTGMSLVQVGLGLSTLLLYVPIPLAAVHQAGSLVLLTLITCSVHSLNFAKHATPNLMSQARQFQTLSTAAMAAVRGPG
jgi:heme A synthase